MGAGLPHVGPSDYIQDVPMLWLGRGHVQARGAVDRTVTVAGIDTTVARLLQFDGFSAPDGRPMTEALVPADEEGSPPRLHRDDGLGRGRHQRAGRSPVGAPVPRLLDPSGDVVHGHKRRLVTVQHCSDPRDHRDRGLPQPARDGRSSPRRRRIASRRRGTKDQHSSTNPRSPMSTTSPWRTRRWSGSWARWISTSACSGTARSSPVGTATSHSRAR